LVDRQSPGSIHYLQITAQPQIVVTVWQAVSPMKRAQIRMPEHQQSNALRTLIGRGEFGAAGMALPGIRISNDNL